MTFSQHHFFAAHERFFSAQGENIALLLQITREMSKK
jgi:hypothetical protein